MPRRLPPRSAIAGKDTWNATSVFPSPAACRRELAAILGELPGLGGTRAVMRRDAAGLGEGLATVETIRARALRVLAYAYFAASVDTLDADASALNEEAQGAWGQVSAACAFVDPMLLEIGRETLEAWRRSEPGLTLYGHAFDALFRRQAHVRSAEVEELLGMAAEPFFGAENTAGALLNADLVFAGAKDAKGRTREVSQASVFALMEERDRTLRRSAWESFMAGHASVRTTLASALATSIKQDVFRSRARRFDSSLAASLDPDNIPMAVFHNAVAVFRQNLPTWHRYFDLRRRVLGVKRLGHFDIWAPLASRRVRIPLERGVQMICEGLAPMGRDYVESVRRGCSRERWLDAQPNRGKREGAFSAGSPGTHPFVLMSWTDDITSLSTLAHELGHSMHSLHSWRSQPFAYAPYPLFLAEVASNFHQALVRASLLERRPDLEVPVLEEAMANFFRYLFIMPTLARFELETHGRAERGEALTADIMGEITTRLLTEAYGPGVAVEPEREGMVWASFTHLYVPFYVFQYETGIAGAQALAGRVLRGEPGAVPDYLRFISAGSSGYPVDILKQAGVDLSRPEPIQEAFSAMGACVERLEELLV